MGLLLRLQDLPWPWPHLGQGRRQELQVLVFPHPQGPYAEEEPEEDHLDCALPQEAQEGSLGGCDQEEDSPCPEVPACRRWSYSAGYHGKEEPEARGAKSPEGAGCPRRQGSEESHRQEARCQGQGCAEGTEGNKECPEGRPRQGWWQEINILPSNSCNGNLINILPSKSCGNLFNK